MCANKYKILDERSFHRDYIMDNVELSAHNKVETTCKNYLIGWSALYQWTEVHCYIAYWDTESYLTWSIMHV